MPRNSNAVCVPCRVVVRVPFGGGTCPNCKEPMQARGPKWRAPKKNDDAAWKQIEAGNWLWEIDPKQAQWDARDDEVNRQNPKQGKTKLFPTLADARKNWRLRWNMRPHL